MRTDRIGGIDELARFGELDGGLLQVVQRAFDEHALLLVHDEQMVPEFLARKNLRIADDDRAVSENHYDPIGVLGVRGWEVSMCFSRQDLFRVRT
jgi:hypothetical protein